jgi:hypothetical protein
MILKFRGACALAIGRPPRPRRSATRNGQAVLRNLTFVIEWLQRDNFDIGPPTVEEIKRESAAKKSKRCDHFPDEQDADAGG